MTDLTREGLVELAGRCEQVSGPDRALDCLIGDAIGARTRNGVINVSATYTASLDAAMTLVPEGLWAEGSLSSPGQLEVHGPCTYDPLGKGWAATPALALCAAALKARARAMEAGHG